MDGIRELKCVKDNCINASLSVTSDRLPSRVVCSGYHSFRRGASARHGILRAALLLLRAVADELSTPCGHEPMLFARVSAARWRVLDQQVLVN